MRFRRGICAGLAAALAAAGDTLAGASDAPQRCLQPIVGSDGVKAYRFSNKENYKIVLDDSQWPTSTINGIIAKIILEEHMGYNVTFQTSGGLDSWEPISKGEVHANLEVWESELEKTYNAQYISSTRTVEDLGALGVVARNGWYVPSEFAEEYPSMSTYLGIVDPDALQHLRYTRVCVDKAGWTDGYNGCAEYGASSGWCDTYGQTGYTSEGSAKEACCACGGGVVEGYNYTLNASYEGFFIGPPVFWAPKRAEEQIARNLNLPLTVHYAQDYMEYLDNMLDCLLRRKGHSGRCIMYNYFPSTIKSGFDISRVSLPEHTSECYAKGDDGGIDCDYDYFILYKIAWAQLDTYAPDAYQVLQQFKLTKNDQEAMLANYMAGMNYYEIACKWITENEERWTSWIPLDFADWEPPVPAPQAQQTSKWLFVLMYVLAGLLAVILLAVFLTWLAWTIRSKGRLQQQVKRDLQLRMEECKSALKRLSFPMYVVNGTDWVRLKAIEQHETLRDQRMLKVLDDLYSIIRFKDSGNRIAFLSHQWLAWARPDPEGKQWTVMREAVRFLARKDNLRLDQICSWVDFSGIPQKNKSAQALAIDALPNYAANSDYFIVVAPSTEHIDTGITQNLSSYNSRMWCRAEQLSRISTCGLKDFYLADEAGVFTGIQRLGTQEAWDEYLDSSLRVFDGGSSCCSLRHVLDKRELACDREKLVNPMMSLVATMHAQMKLGLDDLDPDSQMVIHKLHSKLNDVFPKMHTVVKEDKCEKRALFGELVATVLKDVDSHPNSWLSPGLTTLRNDEIAEPHGHLSSSPCATNANLDKGEVDQPPKEEPMMVS